MINPNPSLNRDEWLAAFADQALEGRPADPSIPAPDLETRALVDVVLRLNHAFFQKDLEAAAVKRMQGETLARWRKEEQNRKNSWSAVFRLDWLTPSRRSQFGWAFAMIAIAGILFLSFPTLSSSSNSITGSAGLQSPGAFLWIIPMAALLAMAWLLRRKP